MERYELRVLPSVRKDLRGLPKNEVGKILARFEGLAIDPRPHDCRKLSGRELYRVRSGVYRILYEIHDDEVVIVVVKVGHRRTCTVRSVPRRKGPSIRRALD